MRQLLGAVNLKSASEGKKDTIWNDTEKYPEIIGNEKVRGRACSFYKLTGFLGSDGNRL